MIGVKTWAALALAVAVTAHPSSLEKRALSYGSVYAGCTKPGVVALSFDDGPSLYTEELLDTLDAGGHKATFFLTGVGYGNIWDNQDVVRRMMNTGHQIGSHTWSHKDLATISREEIRSEMTQLEDALIQITGVYPYYMRPPYLSTNAAALDVLSSMGYYVINVNIDTLDWKYDTTDPYKSVELFRQGYEAGGSIALAHDPHAITVRTIIPEIINYLARRGVKSVTIGECLGEPSYSFYRTRGGSNSPGSSSGIISPDQTCGGSNGYVCGNSNCCSQFGYCGATSDYCGSGCQSSFGKCTGSSNLPTSTNGRCGAQDGRCPGNQCCSQFGWCDTSSQFCGAGCQPLYGRCS